MNKKLRQLRSDKGLLPKSYDERDERYSHHRHFGTLGAAEIPLVDFDVDTPISIEDQKDLDFCTGYAGAEMAGDLFNDDFCPLYQFAKAKQMRGEYEGWGAELRDLLKGMKHFGSLPKRHSPFTYKEGKPTDRDRDFLANWENWPKELDAIAAGYRIGAYYPIDGPNDFFDNIRSAMWLHKDEDKSVIGGVIWNGAWDSAIIPDVKGKYAGSGHAINHKGQKIIKKKPYIKTLNSYGKKHGKGGYNFFPRSVINQNEEYGAYYIATEEEVLNIKFSILRVLKPLYELVINLFRQTKMGSALPPAGVLSALLERLKASLISLLKSMPSNTELIYKTAKAALGTEASKNDVAPDNLACMETVDDLVYKAIGKRINGTKNTVTVSTAEGLKILERNPEWEEIYIAEPGAIIMSATGTGNGNIKHGHVGICGYHGIMSNDSRTGTFEQNFSYEGWNKYYGQKGGFPIRYFRRK